MAINGAMFRSKVANIPVHVLKKEAHNLSSVATQYPIESAISLSDHIIMNPNVLDITFEMVNMGGGREQAIEAMNTFIRLQNSREYITIDTFHARYKNMVLISVNPVHQSPYLGSLVFNVRFQQVGFIGDGDYVSASGGRSAQLLAPDATSKTGSAFIEGGNVAPVRNEVLISKCETQGFIYDINK